MINNVFMGLEISIEEILRYSKIQVILNLDNKVMDWRNTTLLLNLADDVAVGSKSYITELTLLPCSFS